MGVLRRDIRRASYGREMSTSRIELSESAPTWKWLDATERTAEGRVRYVGKLQPRSLEALIKNEFGEQVAGLVASGAPAIDAGIVSVYPDPIGFGGEFVVSASGSRPSLADWIDTDRFVEALRAAIAAVYDEQG